jgi:hypothetical protein
MQIVPGQDLTPFDSWGWILLATPISGAPVSAEQREELVLLVPDGGQQREFRTTRIFRDSAGRVRAEHIRAVENHDNPMPFVIVTILDPPTRSLITLFPREKGASRITSPSTTEGFKYAVTQAKGELSAGSPGTRTANLGTRVIEGIGFQGTRTEPADQGPASALAFTERWHSVQLGLTQSLVVANTTARHTATLEHIRRNEPDPGLFMVPPEYDIEEVEWPTP